MDTVPSKALKFILLVAPSPLKPTTEFFASARGRGVPAYRGRGRGGPQAFIPSRPSADTPFPGKGRGFDIPRRQVQGIGAPKGAQRPIPVGAKQTLSSLLLQERPLLKPIMFVPSTEMRFLFQNEEELLQPIVEDVGGYTWIILPSLHSESLLHSPLGDTIQSPIPTADRVTRVFSGGIIPPDEWDNDGGDTEGEIEEVDFNDLGKLLLPTTTNSKTAIPKCKTQVVQVENPTVRGGLTTRNANQKSRPLPTEIESRTKMADKLLSVQNGIGINGNHLFYVDTQPRNVPSGMEFPTSQQPSSSYLPGGDDDIIVYEAPHPRNTFRMCGRDTDFTESSREILTTNEHWGFSTYERHGALPTSGSHSQPKSTISIVGEEPVSSMSPMTVTTTEPASFTSITNGKSTLPDTVETTNAAKETSAATTTTRLRLPPITTPRQAKLWKSKLSRAKKGSPRTPFSAFGTMREEDLLRRLDGERDERYNERRKGDSDIEWGETTDDGGENVVDVGKEVVAEEPESELDIDMKRVLGMLEKGKGLNQASDDIDNGHGMEVDIDIDIATLQRFARGLTGPDAERHVTMDDIECEEIMRMEDEGDRDVALKGSSSSEVDEETADEEEEEALRIEEAKFIRDEDLGNPDRDDDEETDDLGESADDDDDDNYEDNSFRFKLDRLRSMTKTVKGDPDVEDDILERNLSLADLDEAFIRDIDVRSKQFHCFCTYYQCHRICWPKRTTFSPLRIESTSRNCLLPWVVTTKIRIGLPVCILKFYHGRQFISFSFVGWRRDKNMGIPPELSIQYEIDRLKKAERKRARELERATDLLSNEKKGRKAMFTAAAIEPTIIATPNRVIDMTTLVQNIRRFISDLGGPSSMSLPPTDKETRKNTHEIAAVFNLKSVSKGKGDARYITLAKTTKTNIQVNEGKIARILRRSGAKGEGVWKVPRHREGDVVGMAAPKLDKSNVGFKLLAMMGWSEGDRIGASTNGLEAPLTAVIKTTKLGLGAKK